jgi:hypothetical protein
MTSSYLVRLSCICLASFFLVHLAVGVVVSLMSPALIRRAGRLQASAGARLLLMARVTPAVIAALLVAGLCVPSFLWLEQNAGAEEIGRLCLTAAACGFLIVAASISRSARAILRSRRYIRQIQNADSRVPQVGGRRERWIVDTAHVWISLAGVWRPRVFVSRAIVELLSRDQLAAALRHERAHRDSRDNLKRLIILAAPGLFPFLNGFRKLDCAWTRFTEWAADDRAVAGSSHRSLSLAAALVRVARLGRALEPQPLVTSLVGGGEDLSMRVERLLRGAAQPPEKPRQIPVVRIVLPAGLLLAAVLHPVTLTAVHGLLEDLIR